MNQLIGWLGHEELAVPRAPIIEPSLHRNDLLSGFKDDNKESKKQTPQSGVDSQPSLARIQPKHKSDLRDGWSIRARPHRYSDVEERTVSMVQFAGNESPGR
jgi:hypothetical protein